MALSGALAIFVVLIGVTAHAHIFDPTSMKNQLREEVMEHKLELEDLGNHLLAEAHADLDNLGYVKRENVFHWSNDSMETSKNKISNYSGDYLAEIEQTKGKLMEKGSFHTYQKEKNEEIEERITETLKDILQ